MSKAAAGLVGSRMDSLDIRATWAWHRGDRQAAANTAGLVALALIEYHVEKGGQASLEAARGWAEARLEDIASWKPLFDPDVEALARLSVVTGDGRYEGAARQAFQRRWKGASGEEIVGRLRIVRRQRPELLGFDAALVIRAAIAVGEHHLALETAEAALRVLSGFSVTHGDVATDVEGLLTTSVAALLDAILALEADRITPGWVPQRRTLQEMARWLSEQQGRSGAWAEENTQSTAYAVVALAREGSQPSLAAAARGQAWLIETQLADGFWASFNDGLPEPFVGDVIHEVTAEALQALLVSTATHGGHRR